jgi:hypothetical protein
MLRTSEKCSKRNEGEAREKKQAVADAIVIQKMEEEIGGRTEEKGDGVAVEKPVFVNDRGGNDGVDNRQHGGDDGVDADFAEEEKKHEREGEAHGKIDDLEDERVVFGEELENGAKEKIERRRLKVEVPDGADEVGAEEVGVEVLDVVIEGGDGKLHAEKGEINNAREDEGEGDD